MQTAGDAAHPWKASQREGPALCAAVTPTLSAALYVLWDDNRKLHFLGMIMIKPKFFSAPTCCPYMLSLKVTPETLAEKFKVAVML